MPLQIAWVAGVLIAGIGTLILAIVRTDSGDRRSKPVRALRQDARTQ